MTIADCKHAVILKVDKIGRITQGKCKIGMKRCIGYSCKSFERGSAEDLSNRVKKL